MQARFLLRPICTLPWKTGWHVSTLVLECWKGQPLKRTWSVEWHSADTMRTNTHTHTRYISQLNQFNQCKIAVFISNEWLTCISLLSTETLRWLYLVTLSHGPQTVTAPLIPMTLWMNVIRIILHTCRPQHTLLTQMKESIVTQIIMYKNTFFFFILIITWCQFYH